LAFPAGNAGSGIGLAFLSGNSLNQGVVTNEGSEKASPIIFIRNQASNPQIVNQTNGQSITVKNMSITDGHYLVIDVANRTILMDGDPNNSRYGYIDWTSSNWLVLEPGNNTIQYNASSPGSNSTVDILWRGRWI
jgi:phage-related protein